MFFLFIIAFSLFLWFWNPRLRKRLVLSKDNQNDCAVINATEFYSQYHGHPISSLAILEKSLRSQKKAIIWLVGDSSLDNKYWLGSNYPMFYNAVLCNGYEKVVKPIGVPDVCYWLNYYLSSSSRRFAAINCAVEASTLYDRSENLLPQDEFVQKHMKSEDVVIFSIGGNDVVLNPSFRILASLAILIYLIPECLLSNALVKWIFFSPLRDLFRNQLKSYVEKICVNQRPSQFVFCSYYYPCLKGSGWADIFLKLANYDKNPRKIQKLFDIVASDFHLNEGNFPGTKVTKVNFSQILSPDNESDYIARVEPSSTGGQKMAQFLCISLH